MDLSDEELFLSSDKTWEKILIDIDQNEIFQTNIDTDVNDLPDAKHLKVLFQKFGHKNFRPLQWKIIKSILTHKRDNCAVMATGYGKSLCYQFPAVYSEGIAIVISPLISLMEDQVLSLTMKNISSCLLGTAQTNKYINDEILENKYSIIYLTPEFCTSDCGIDLLKKMHSQLRITLIAVDEAHCVSSWGHDFRHCYRKLGVLKDNFCDVPLLALTATATEPVKKDIVKSLKLKDPQVLCSGYDRPNLYFSVRPKSGNTWEDLKSLMIRKDSRWVFDGPTIIYCITKKDTQKIYELLQSFEIVSTMYHAGMSLKNRKEAHENFVKDKVSVMVATIAFGMGIDKPDIRNIIHYGHSNSIEAYYQEVGRGGRDGLPAKCVTFCSGQDLTIHSFLIQDSNNKNERFKLLDKMNEYLMINKCRRQFILSYFTGNVDLKLPQKNKCCDNCSQGNSIRDGVLINKEMYDFTEDAVTFFSAVNAMNGEFGVNKYILFLMGSKSDGVLNRFKKHSCYGSGAHKSVDWWKAIAKFLQLHKYLAMKPRRKLKFSYFVTCLTDKGLTFLQQPHKKLIEQPTAEIMKFFKKEPCSSGWISANGSSSSSSTTTLASIPKNNMSVIPKTEVPDNTETEDTLKLFRLLKTRRTHLAVESNCMPYMIAPDFVLMEMAKQRPLDLTQLHNMQIEGLSEAIISKFGADLLEVVKDNTDLSSFTGNSTQTPKSSILDILRDYPMENLDFTDTAMITYSYFEKGLTLQDIALERNIRLRTIQGHLLVAMKMGYPITMEQLGVNQKIRTSILQVINNLGGQYSSVDSIMKACPLDVSYHQVQVVCTYVEVRVHLGKIGKPYEEFETFLFLYKDCSPIIVGDVKDEAPNDDNDALLIALCKALDDAAADKSDDNDDLNGLKNTLFSDTSVYADSESPSKKIKTETNTVLNSPPRECSDATVNACDLEDKIVEIINKEGQAKIQEDKVIKTLPKPKNKLPQWLSKKRKF